MIKFEFKSFRQFNANLDRRVLNRWLRGVQTKSLARLKLGFRVGPRSGHVAKRSDGSIFLRSAPGQWPAIDSGRLIASAKTRGTKDSAVVGTNMFYAKFLRNGTRKMKARRMSKDAMLIGACEAKPMSEGWVKWHKGKPRNVTSLNN